MQVDKTNSNQKTKIMFLNHIGVVVEAETITLQKAVFIIKN